MGNNHAISLTAVAISLFPHCVSDYRMGIIQKHLMGFRVSHRQHG